MAKEILYPQRQRCKECGRGFTELGGLMGLYCSYKCAKMPTPFKAVADAPRWCKTEKDGKWQWKKRFRSFAELPKALRDDPSSSTYWCSHCALIHVGHSRVELKRESTRRIGDRKQLADVLVKCRGGATHREVGKAAGVQPIRIKELEDPAFAKVDAEALFRLLKFYKVKMALTF